jgi:thioredoxin reductase
MIFDALIIGGGVSGMQCALLLGAAKSNPFALNKKIGIVLHQRASHLENALFNNVLGLHPNSLGKDVLVQGKEQLKNLYPDVMPFF